LRYPQRQERIFRTDSEPEFLFEVATKTLLRRRSYGQAVQSGIKLPLRGDSLWISQWRYENSKCVRSLCDCAQFFGAHYSRLCIGQTVAQENCAYLIKFGEVDIMQAALTRYFPDTLNRVDVRTIKRQKVESIRTLQIANASQKTR
jgi:hypothetical protein